MITVYDAVAITDGVVFILSTEPSSIAAQSVIAEEATLEQSGDVTFDVFDYEVDFDSFEEFESASMG